MALTSAELPAINSHNEGSIKQDASKENPHHDQTSRRDDLEDKMTNLKAEVEALKREVAVLKKALRDKIARYEISQVKHGRYAGSIVE